MKETLLFGRDVSNSDSNLNSTPASTTITTPLLSQAFDGGDGEDTVAYETERHALVYKKHFFFMNERNTNSNAKGSFAPS